jgi:uncharacterized protein YkwD
VSSDQTRFFSIFIIEKRHFLKPILFFLLFITSFRPALVLGQHASSNKDFIADILKYVNEHRRSIGLNALTMNDVICKEAETHSKNMASGRVPFSHNGFDGRTSRIKAKLKNVNAWAENVAFGPATARDVVDLWLNSPGHRKNIEGSYNLTGIGIAQGKDGTLYYTQIFINKQ